MYLPFHRPMYIVNTFSSKLCELGNFSPAATFQELHDDCDIYAATGRNVHQKITEITSNYQSNLITNHILKLTDPNWESTQQIQRESQCLLARIIARFITQCLNTRTEFINVARKGNQE